MDRPGYQRPSVADNDFVKLIAQGAVGLKHPIRNPRGAQLRQFAADPAGHRGRAPGRSHVVELHAATRGGPAIGGDRDAINRANVAVGVNGDQGFFGGGGELNAVGLTGGV